MNFSRRLKAFLEGWSGPLFPVGIDELTQVFMSGKITPEQMDEMRTKARVTNWIGRVQPTTKDGFAWHTGHYFLMPEGYIAILFPPRDSGTSCAVYTQGLHQTETIQRLVKKITAALTQLEAEG